MGGYARIVWEKSFVHAEMMVAANTRLYDGIERHVTSNLFVSFGSMVFLSSLSLLCDFAYCDFSLGLLPYDARPSFFFSFSSVSVSERKLQ